MTHLSIGERIRALRTEQGLTQKQLGERCGMSDAEIRKFESDRGSPTVRSLQRIADALGSSVAFLVDEHGASREATTGQRIRMARERAGMKQRDLADKLGVSYVNVSQWERDTRNPKYSTLQKISDAVGISVTFLLGLESTPSDEDIQDIRCGNVHSDVEERWNNSEAIMREEKRQALKRELLALLEDEDVKMAVARLFMKLLARSFGDDGFDF